MRYIVLFVTMFVISSYAQNFGTCMLSTCDTQTVVKKGYKGVTARDWIPSDQCGDVVSFKGWLDGVPDKGLRGRLGHIYSDAITFGEDDEGDPFIHKAQCCFVGFKDINNRLTVTVFVYTEKKIFTIYYQQVDPNPKAPYAKVIEVKNRKTGSTYKFLIYARGQYEPLR